MRQLLQRVAEGDEAAFSTLFFNYLGVIEPFIRKLTRSAADTEEVVQETFMRVWMWRDRLEEVKSFDAWIYTIAINECYRWLKKQSRRRRGLAALNKTAEVSALDGTLDGLQLREVSRLVAEAVSRLPARRRHIYQMSRDEGMKIEEIADRLSLSPNTVKNTLVASLRFIRNYLAKRGHEL